MTRSKRTPVGREVFYVDERYTSLKPIGDGTYGFVCSARDTATGKEVAIKKVSRVFKTPRDSRRILREIKLLRHLHGHANVVDILDIMIADPFHEFEAIYIVTELMESDLNRILASRQRLTEVHFQYFLYQILRGLKYIHSANVLHRDLKPSNLLLNSDCHLSICDFGLARGVEFENEECADLTEYVVTRWYRAPELLCDSSRYGTGVDMWSVGCIFAEMLQRRPWVSGSSPMHQLKCIISKLGCFDVADLDFVKASPAADYVRSAVRACRSNGPPMPLSEQFPPNTSAEAIDLLQRMLKFDPGGRISVQQALEHPYLAELHSQFAGDEPTCPTVFDTEFEKQRCGPDGYSVPPELLRGMLYREMLHYRPEESSNMPPDMLAQLTPPSTVHETPAHQHDRHASPVSSDKHSTLNSGRSPLSPLCPNSYSPQYHSARSSPNSPFRRLNPDTQKAQSPEDANRSPCSMKSLDSATVAAITGAMSQTSLSEKRTPASVNSAEMQISPY